MKLRNTPFYKRCLTALIALALMAAPLTAFADEWSVVKGGSLNLRQSASLSAAILGSYPTGTWVQVESTDGGWSKVTVAGKNGYMSNAYLKSQLTAGKATVRTYSSRGLNLRAEPSTEAPILTSYKTGTVVDVLLKGNGWYRVKAGEQTGYMASAYLLAGSVPTSTDAVIATGTVNNPRSTQVLNLRETASLQARVLAYFRNGVQVDIIAKLNGWYKVRVNGLTGYMASQFIKLN